MPFNKTYVFIFAGCPMKTIIAAVLLFAGIYAYPQSFDDYKKSVDRDFAGPADFGSYKESVGKEFETYKRIFDEEFSLFAGKVRDEWGDGVITSDKIWVEYSHDMKTRKIINFETGEMKIQIKNNSAKADKETLAREVAAFISEDGETAFKNDILAQNVEKRMKASGIKAEYSSAVPGGAVLMGLVTGLKNPGPRDIAKAAAGIVNGGSVNVENLPDGTGAVTLNYALSVEKEPDDTGRAPLTANKTVGKIHKKAEEFKGPVSAYAAERKMPEALIYAVIHNESSFNPRATSPVPAYGMMQLVPSSGGAEAAAVYFGKPVVLGPSYLYNPDNNIKLGATYLSQLYYNYFKGVKNPETRLYCTISAYNTGPGNVSRAFTGNRKLADAIPVINGMTPERAYDTLVKKLPYDETRTYLQRVSSSYNAYYDFK